MAIDPVCGMQVDITARHERAGVVRASIVLAEAGV